jgi:GT2 family glycosyltransferase
MRAGRRSNGHRAERHIKLPESTGAVPIPSSTAIFLALRGHGRISVNYPRIDPPTDGHRPFWSVMIPAYNPGYLEEAIRSVLEQATASADMQITVVDDCSSSDIKQRVHDIAGDRIDVFRNESNLGPSGNFTRCVQLARGRWVHILHADDMVLPGFYKSYYDIIDANPNVTLVHGRYVLVNERGEWQSLDPPPKPWTESDVCTDAFRDLINGNPIVASSAVVSRDAYQRLGGFAPILNHTQDWEMWGRLSRSGAVGYCRQPSVLYRVHDGSDTFRIRASGADVTEEMLGAAVMLSSLDRDDRSRWSPVARRRRAQGACSRARECIAAGSWRNAWRFISWSIALDCSILNIVRNVYSVFGSRE